MKKYLTYLVLQNKEVNDKISLNYNFSIDQNYSDFNYNEIGTSFNLNPIKVDLDYLQEKKALRRSGIF